MMNPKRVRTAESTGGVLEVTLDRPDAANAIDLPMARELADVARACEVDRALRGVVLTGAGSRFCAGGDVRSFAAVGDALPAALRELTMHLHAALGSFARMNAPLVTAVNGVAAGAGLGLAMAGDLCLAARSATFRSAYTAIGLSPDAGTSFWLPRLVGLRRAQELIFTNVALDAERALAWGLVTELVDDGSLRERALAVAAKLAALPAGAPGESRRNLLASFESDYAKHLDREARSVSALASAPETRRLSTPSRTGRSPSKAGYPRTPAALELGARRRAAPRRQ